jgi:hypothetical protein
MGNIVKSDEGQPTSQTVRCPICAHPNAPMHYCRHVRWTFDQGDPMDFAHFAMETSPYTKARGFSLDKVPRSWWDENIEWVVDQVMLRFDAVDGYVFGELADLDLLARDVWRAIRPDNVRREMARVDLF